MSSVHTARPRRRGAPPMGARLTRADVIARAAELIDRDGLAAFSLRTLATALDVRPSALYNHVRNLDDLLTAVAGSVLAQFTLDDRPAPWPLWLRRVAVDMRQWLLQRPELAAVVIQHGPATDAGSTLLLRLTERLTAAEVDRSIAHLAWHVLLTTVLGALHQDLARGISTDGTFEHVLDVAIDGLVRTTDRPVDPDLRKLVRAHGYSDR